MVNNTLYVLIEIPQNAPIRVHGHKFSRFIARNPKTRVFERSGVKFHVLVTGRGKQPVKTVKRILDNYWEILVQMNRIVYL